MAADPDWQVYLKKNAEAGNLENQTTKLMNPGEIRPARQALITESFRCAPMTDREAAAKSSSIN